MKRIILLIVLSVLFLLQGCKNSLTNPKDPNLIIATGTNNNIDKEKYGDFQLVLEMEKLTFKYNSPINIKVYFKNIGNKTITLDGILPFRNSANPPSISIWSDDKSLRFHLSEYVIKENLLNSNDIIVEVGKSVTLIDFDLRHARGYQLYADTSGVGYNTEELTNIYSKFIKGNYNINASFWPGPKAFVYKSSTDTLQFKIK